MTTKFTLGFVIVIVCLQLIHCGFSDAQTPSIWQRREARMVDLFTDVKARETGDLLFVTINERSDVQNKDQRLMRKLNSSSSDGTGTYGFGGGIGTATGNLNFTQESAADRSFNGDTQFKSERGFIDRFTVTVIDTLPNGNLLIHGTRNVSLEGDNRTLILSGVVRSNDVNMDNSVSSQLVSDLSIRYESAPDSGAERKFINQGWLGKKLNRFWPH